MSGFFITGFLECLCMRAFKSVLFLTALHCGLLERPIYFGLYGMPLYCGFLVCLYCRFFYTWLFGIGYVFIARSYVRLYCGLLLIILSVFF